MKNKGLVYFVFSLVLLTLLFNFCWQRDVKAEINFQAPFRLVDDFYTSVSKGEWKKVEGMVTPEWWVEMTRSGYRGKWESLHRQYPSLHYSLFLVSDQKIDFAKDSAWVMGKVDWSSRKDSVPDENVTVFFRYIDNAWKISGIRLNLPVETVDHFYQGINAGHFRAIRYLTAASYWEKLQAGGVISAMKADWRKNRTGIYCVFFLDDFGLSQNKAWVKGWVLWNVLSSKEMETPVTVFLSNEKGWKISRIKGHWELQK